jgi:hypothetical protein
MKDWAAHKLLHASLKEKEDNLAAELKVLLSAPSDARLRYKCQMACIQEFDNENTEIFTFLSPFYNNRP